MSLERACVCDQLITGSLLRFGGGMGQNPRGKPKWRMSNLVRASMACWFHELCIMFRGGSEELVSLMRIGRGGIRMGTRDE